MNAAKTILSQQFGIGTRTEIRLDQHNLLTLSVRAGDLLRSDGGTVWATVDGELDDILLGSGDVYAVPSDREIRVSAFGHVRLEVYGQGPLQYEVPRLEPAGGATAFIWQAWVGAMRAAIGSTKAPAVPAWLDGIWATPRHLKAKRLTFLRWQGSNYHSLFHPLGRNHVTQHEHR